MAEPPRICGRASSSSSFAGRGSRQRAGDSICGSGGPIAELTRLAVACGGGQMPVAACDCQPFLHAAIMAFADDDCLKKMLLDRGNLRAGANTVLVLKRISEVRVRVARLFFRRLPMNIFLEILSALANTASIWSLLLELYDRWREYRHQRMTKGGKEGADGNRPL